MCDLLDDVEYVANAMMQSFLAVVDVRDCSFSVEDLYNSSIFQGRLVHTLPCARNNSWLLYFALLH